ncbi:MAG: SURF1 family protein [Gemmatimonadetes bacterium]|nr:SURF1 family protein [Gemmatimonadota bacterium]
MRPKALLGLAIPLACAALFVRLGFWQVSRHKERAAYNAAVAARLAEAPAPFASLPGDSGAVRGRRVTLTGRFRYDLEQVLAARSNGGAPGVHLLTPLEREGSDTLVIVTRGWVFSPDAAGVDRALWREADTVTLSGYASPLLPEGPPPPADPLRPLRSLSQAALAARLGRPVAAAQIVMTSDSAGPAGSVPRRLGVPELSGGPHRSYAIQWFSFALIAVVGGVLLFRRGIVADGARA